ncbi:MAG: ATP-binding cassette domain-containing protein, partial [Evtepia gabavorous]
MAAYPVVAVFYVLMFLYVRFSGRRSRPITEAAGLPGELDIYIEEMMAGQKVVKVFNHEEESQGVPEKNSPAESGHRRAELCGHHRSGGGQHLLRQLRPCGGAGRHHGAEGMTDAGSLASYLVFVRQAAAPINQFTQQSNFLLAALAGAERVFEVMDEAPEVDEGAVSLEKAGQGWAWHKPEGEDIPLRGDVRFEHVDFGYEPRHPVLRDVSLYAKPGQKIAFVGSTGAGKTTITNLINRFYDVQGGRILYDGIDVRDIQKSALRSSLGIVLQDTHLFTGTIADNIRFGKLDATMEEIQRAACIANALLEKGIPVLMT